MTPYSPHLVRYVRAEFEPLAWLLLCRPGKIDMQKVKQTNSRHGRRKAAREAREPDKSEMLSRN